jgi:F-type H+-transporting ATPase subunit a
VADPLHQFVIEPWIPLEVGALDLSYTNSSFWMTVALGVSVLFFTTAMAKRALVPGRMQIFAEMIYRFVADMIQSNLGARGQQYFAFIFTMFIAVLMGNVLGMLPYAFTFTSHIAVTGALALLVFFMVTIIGFVRHGTHFLALFCPPGAPLWVTPLIVPIEIISYLSRPVTLSLRLFINMFAGHLLLKVIAGFCVAMVTSLGLTGFLGALLPMGFNVLFIGFEIFIALIQAYVFTLLTCIYLKDTIEIAH